jgi:hypothetical protein
MSTGWEGYSSQFEDDTDNPLTAELKAGARAMSGTRWGAAMSQAAEALRALRVGHDRYETVRLMKPGDFLNAFVLNTRTGKPFDEIVDDLRPFVRPNV